MTIEIFYDQTYRENVPEVPSGIANDRATASDFQGLI